MVRQPKTKQAGRRPAKRTSSQEDYMMKAPMNRRHFVASSAALGLSSAIGSLITHVAGAQNVTPPRPLKERERPSPLSPDRVEAFVRVAHGNLDQVRAMLAEEPGLINATWDWGGGDFETALGGASHMGNREIALHLLANGARLDLFAAAMLGQLPIVHAALAVDPSALHVPGPHGISLITHARKGGKEATDVLAYLEGLA